MEAQRWQLSPQRKVHSQGVEKAEESHPPDSLPHCSTGLSWSGLVPTSGPADLPLRVGFGDCPLAIVAGVTTQGGQRDQAGKNQMRVYLRLGPEGRKGAPEGSELDASKSLVRDLLALPAAPSLGGAGLGVSLLPHWVVGVRVKEATWRQP